MFDDTLIEILGNTYNNTPLKSVWGDLQDNTTTIKNNGFEWDCTKLLIVDKDSLFQMNFYLKIENKIYKIIKIDSLAEHLEIYLFECNFLNVKVNDDNEMKKILINETEDKIINAKDEKIVISDFILKTGDILEFDGYKWIIVSQIVKDFNIYRGRIIKIEDNFNVYIGDKLYNFDCIIESSNNGIKEGKYIITGDGNLKITVQDNSLINQIHEDMRIIKWGYAWKVIAKSGENKGLTYIFFEKDATNSATDDIENEIADRWKYEVKHNYSIETPSIELNINKGNTKQLSVIVKDRIDSGTVVVENPTIMYVSGDDNIVTVSNRGLITGVNEGNTTITIKFENIEKIINISVSNVVELIIIGRDTMTLDRTREYTSNIPVNWTIEDINNKSGKPWATIISETDTTATVKTTSDWIFTDDSCKYFNIIATDKNNSSNVIKKKIEITAY